MKLIFRQRSVENVCFSSAKLIGCTRCILNAKRSYVLSALFGASLVNDVADDKWTCSAGQPDRGKRNNRPKHFKKVRPSPSVPLPLAQRRTKCGKTAAKKTAIEQNATVLHTINVDWIQISFGKWTIDFFLLYLRCLRCGSCVAWR